MHRATSARLARLSGRLVITRAELIRAHVNPDIAGRLVRRGCWRRLASGIYLPHDRTPTEAELVAAATAHVGRTFVVTGAIPLRAIGARWIPTRGGIHVLVPRSVHVRSNGCIQVTTTTCYNELDTWVRNGARYADPARAIIDVARSSRSLRTVRGVVLAAVADRWATPGELLAILATGQRNGSGLAKRAIRDVERGCASPPEAELVDALIGCGLPFYVNPELRLHGAALGYPDVWLVGLGIGGEVDSVERHEGEDQTESTYDRHERITTPGLELVHLSVRRIRADVREAAAHLVGRARARAGSGAATEPAGLTVVPRGPLLR